MAKLRKMLTHPGKNESGQGVLAIVLMLLMLGAVIITPLLVFMNTGLKAGGVYESKLQEFYAADSGVEAAIYQISQNNTTPMVPPYTLNDRNVTVTIGGISGGGYSGYKIISTAISNSGGNTTIECYYGALDYSGLLNDAITSDGTVCVKGVVNGSIVAANCTSPQGMGCNNTNCTTNTTINWPTAEQLSAWYWDQVKNLQPPFPYSDPLNIAGTNTTIQALYRDGPWTIYNKGNPATLTLNGTVYVTGDLTIGTTDQDFTLNLNKQTIFVNSSSANAITVGGKVNVIGSGCIIAVGDVYFAPKGDVGSPDNFVFIMSVEGTVLLQPSGTFYGAIAGNLKVIQQPGYNPNITWISPGNGSNLNFPTGSVMKVLSYTIK